MSSRERIPPYKLITNKSLFIVCGVGWEEKDLGITWSFTGKGGGGKQSSPTGYTGGNSRKMTANKPPMRAGGGHEYYRALWGEQGEDRQIL